MWILSILPNWTIHAILSVGIIGILVGFLLGMIPFVSKYKLPIQVISILIFALGVYLEGGLADQIEWKLKVKELEAKMANAEVQSVKVNTEIVEKIITKKQIVKQKGDDVIKYIDREVVKYDSKCDIPVEVIKAHDAAAQGKTVEEMTGKKEDSVVTSTTQIPTDELNKAAIGNKNNK